MMKDLVVQGLALLLSLPGLFGLELTELSVPSHANLGHSITLYCWFNLDDASLYSVKWYKDEFEFFRFMPDNKPEMQVFPLAGIMLDESQSDMNKVSLAELNFNSSGNYRCEVSTEAPNFETIFKNSNMTVLAYPDRGPEISGTQAHYLPGDYITANCTSGKSNPPAELEWLINGAKADSWFVEKAVPVVTEARGPMYTRWLGLRFQAHKRYFQSADSTLHLRCSARVGDLPPQHADFYPHLSSRLTNEKLAQERFGNQGTRNLKASHSCSTCPYEQVVQPTRLPGIYLDVPPYDLPWTRSANPIRMHHGVSQSGAALLTDGTLTTLIVTLSQCLLNMS